MKLILIFCIILLGTTFGQDLNQPRLISGLFNNFEYASEKGLELIKNSVNTANGLIQKSRETGVPEKLRTMAVQLLRNELQGLRDQKGELILNLVDRFIPGFKMAVKLIQMGIRINNSLREQWAKIAENQSPNLAGGVDQQQQPPPSGQITNVEQEQPEPINSEEAAPEQETESESIQLKSNPAEQTTSKPKRGVWKFIGK